MVAARSGRRDWELAGLGSGNSVVNFAGDAGWMGRFVPVRITAANPYSLRGEIVVLDSLAPGSYLDGAPVLPGAAAIEDSCISK